MPERSGYVNSDELQADDEISPMPGHAGNDRARSGPTTGGDVSDEENEADLPPRPATSD